jgi:hypothetical protein
LRTEEAIMENPWLDYDFKAENKVHPLDREIFEKVNARFSNSGTKHVLSSKNVALPYFGNPNANFVLLYANPGLKEDTYLEETSELSQLFDLARKHQLNGSSAFVFLQSKFEGTPGFKWWSEALRFVFRRFESDWAREMALSKMFSAEIHPYKSSEYKPLNKKDGVFPTAKYTYELVSKAMERGAVILIGRARDDWFEAVPGLSNYNKVIYLSNPRQKAISPDNVIDRTRGFEKEQAKNYAWQLITKEALIADPGAEVSLPF